MENTENTYIENFLQTKVMATPKNVAFSRLNHIAAKLFKIETTFLAVKLWKSSLFVLSEITTFAAFGREKVGLSRAQQVCHMIHIFELFAKKIAKEISCGHEISKGQIDYIIKIMFHHLWAFLLPFHFSQLENSCDDNCWIQASRNVHWT